MSLFGKPSPVDVYEAVKEKNAKKLSRLIASGADVNTSYAGGPPIVYAARWSSCEVVQLLIAAGADLNARDDSWPRCTALMASAEYGHADKVKALLSAGVDMNAKDDSGKTALFKAAERGGDTDTLLALLEAGADVNAEDNSGNTAIGRAGSYTESGKILKRAQMSQNLLRWERSGVPRKWVEDHRAERGATRNGQP